MQKKIIYFLTVILIGIVCVCAIADAKTSYDMPFHAEILSDGRTESVRLFEDNGDYYLFLPGYAKLKKTKICLDTLVPVFLNGEVVSDGMDCGDLCAGETYELTYTAWGRDNSRTFTILKSENIASMYIDTSSGTMDYIHEKKGNKESGTIRVYEATGEESYAGELAFIKGRGNYTWTEYEKKPYSLKLEESADLLGLGMAQKWILLANAGDPGYIRNKIAYTFAQDLDMAYTSDSSWVDLYLNGEYAGLYQLTERNEVHTQRVNIAQNGSFLISMELEERLQSQNYPYVLTDAEQAFRVHYPLEPEKEELEVIGNHIQTLENAILSDDGIDPVTGKAWTELIDLNSWVKKYLIEEIFGNGDAGAISQYFYLDADDSTGKIYAGPVWDYDRTMGNSVAWHLQNPQTFFANRLHVEQGLDTPWLYSLYRIDIFYEQICKVYQEECLPLLNELLTTEIWNDAEEISSAVQMDEIRWQISDANLISEVEHISSYMSQRVEFLNRIWIEKAPYCEVQADQGFGSHYAHYVVFPGETLPELPQFEDSVYSQFVGWYYVDTDEPVDMTRPVTEDMEIYAKWVDSPSKWIGRVLKLLPLGIIGAMGIVLLCIDCRRGRKSR